MIAPQSSIAGVVVYTPEEAMTTMRTMKRMVLHALNDARTAPFLVHTANDIIAGARARDYDRQIDAIRRFMDACFVFVDNPIGKQRLQPPAALLADYDDRGLMQGSCSDAAILIAALGMANGIPARFVAYAFGIPSGDAATDAAVPYSHVITDLTNGREWIPVDATRPYELWRLPDVVRTETLDLW